jgi:enamine deaminase RidA (YjgF/YER057c/UK114 family)
MKTNVAQKLTEMKLELPPSNPPVANYVPFVISGKTVVVSGQLPMKDGKLQGLGKLGKNISIEEGQELAKICGLNLLSHVKAACGGNLDRVKRVIRLGVFVASAEGFTDQPKVANGVSDLMVSVFGDAGKHARAAVGVSELPFGVAVEVDGMFEID